MGSTVQEIISLKVMTRTFRNNFSNFFSKVFYLKFMSYNIAIDVEIQKILEIMKVKIVLIMTIKVNRKMTGLMFKRMSLGYLAY